MKILIVSNQPVKEYQILCIKILKRYCIVNEFDFIFLNEYKYDEKYDYIIYFDSSNLILNLNVNIKDYIDEKYDLIYLSYPHNIQNINKFIIIKNNNYDIINNVNILKDQIDSNKIFSNGKVINLNENNGYFDNDSLNNNNFIDTVRHRKIFFYTLNLDKISIELKNYAYFQIFNKFYNNKDYINIDIIYDKYNYEGDKEIFNPNKDIAFVTLYTKKIKDEGVEMEYSLKEYCIKNDYTCYIHRKSELDGKRHPTLEKPYLLKKYLNKHKYVIWVDSDILMFNQKFKIEEIFDNKYDLITFKDPDNINYLFNAGFLIFKNTEISLDIINKWIFDIEDKNITEFQGKTKGDQGLINDIIKNEYVDNILIFDNSEINCLLHNYGVNDIKIIHLMGIYAFIRPLFMKYLNYLTFIKNKSHYLVDEQNPHLGGSIEGGDSGTWAPELWNFLIDDLSIKSMIDVGCGEGLTIGQFKNRNVEGLGVEGLQESINRSKVKECIIKHDYTKGPVKIDKLYDFCWSCEFVEHVDEEYAMNFIDTFKNAKYLAMTHAFPNQPGHHHVNCQNSEYWIKLLEENNFKYNNDYTLKLRNMTNNNAVHIKSSLLFFENKNIIL
jgi:hypothetical protein